jgi:hypothetical protein
MTASSVIFATSSSMPTGVLMSISSRSIACTCRVFAGHRQSGRSSTLIVVKMSKAARRGARLGLPAVVMVAIGLLTAPAAYALSWYDTVPTNASNVTTIADDALPDGGVVQIRSGKYDGNTYYWGRVSSPDSKYNTGHDLKFSVGGNCVNNSAGSKTKDINRTTYTSAVRRNNSCSYGAYVINRSTGKSVKVAVYY